MTNFKSCYGYLKLHKAPYDTRIIAALNNCTTKELSCCLHHVSNYSVRAQNEIVIIYVNSGVLQPSLPERAKFLTHLFDASEVYNIDYKRKRKQEQK